jgi:hypothetical protein
MLEQTRVASLDAITRFEDFNRCPKTSQDVPFLTFFTPFIRRVPDNAPQQKFVVSELSPLGAAQSHHTLTQYELQEKSVRISGLFRPFAFSVNAVASVANNSKKASHREHKGKLSGYVT